MLQVSQVQWVLGRLGADALLLLAAVSICIGGMLAWDAEGAAWVRGLALLVALTGIPMLVFGWGRLVAACRPGEPVEEDEPEASRTTRQSIEGSRWEASGSRFRPRLRAAGRARASRCRSRRDLAGVQRPQPDLQALGPSRPGVRPPPCRHLSARRPAAPPPLRAQPTPFRALPVRPRRAGPGGPRAVSSTAPSPAPEVALRCYEEVALKEKQEPTPGQDPHLRPLRRPPGLRFGGRGAGGLGIAAGVDRAGPARVGAGVSPPRRAAVEHRGWAPCPAATGSSK